MLVVGAGISGAMVADALSEAGLRVLVVDRRRPLAGSTSASTALLQYDLDLPLVHLARRIGHERAVRVWRRSKLALDALRERVAPPLDRRGLRRSRFALPRRRRARPGGVARGGRGAPARGVRGLVPAAPPDRRRSTGSVAGAAFSDTATWPPIPGAWRTGSCARPSRGRTTVAWPVEIAKVTPARRGVRADTADGRTIEARHLVFATGYELPEGVPRAGHSIASTWAIATRPQPRRLWPGRCFIWEASDPYLYSAPIPRAA